ncbi:AAA family ATPase [Halobaculum sp. CBA1158]|uniref:RAD55 family ATPase n=1 Tax=Halobaculum sp. CBA1158 TaxID=2904243 RepID=UPI001F1D3939|nr:ATPase domain-containing protein [Halobaculum sp. CBA1158]UIP00083.1 AAA family ATPase [Halobaculum sp. CBA1158]
MRVSTGVTGFDDVVGGGIPAERLYVVCGPPGSGKTTFSAQFVAEGAATGDRCLFISMHESRDDLRADMDSYEFGFGEALDSGSVTFLDAFSSEGKRFFGMPGDRRDVNSVTNRISSFIESRDIDRVVIDSTMLMRYLLDDSDATIMRFLSALKRTSATTFLISEMTDPSAYADEHFLAHGVVFFHNYMEDDGMRRGVQVVKMRGVDADTDIQDVEFTDAGLVVGDGKPVTQ